MDPMDYILHGSPARSSGHYDPVHAVSPGPWVPHPHAAQQNQYRPYPLDHSLPFGLQRPHPSSEPFHHGQGGALIGLPPPGAEFRGMPGPDGHSGLSMPMRHWQHPPHHLPSLSGGPPPHLANQMGMSQEAPFGSMLPSAPRTLGFQGVPRPAAQSVGPLGVTSEHSPQPRWSLPAPGASGNAFGGQQNATSHSPLPHFISSPPRHSSHRSSSSPNHRNYTHPGLPAPSFTNHSQTSAPTTQSGTGSERRRSGHNRPRRSVAPRMSGHDSMGNDDEDHHRVTFETPPPVEHFRRAGGHGSHHPRMNDSEVRNMQMLRGLVTSKMVASKTTLRSLQSVKVEDLPTNERTCVICYNEYGIETPEGVNEAPVQLPKCKHVFGDHCIKIWFEESDSCPYCRDKLESEPKRNNCTYQAFMAAIRSRGLSENAQEELWARAMAHSSQMLDMDFFPGAFPLSARRAPPNTHGDEPRRTRGVRGSLARTDVPMPPDGVLDVMEEHQAAMEERYRDLLNQSNVQLHLATPTTDSRRTSGLDTAGDAASGNNRADGLDGLPESPSAPANNQSPGLGRDRAEAPEREAYRYSLRERPLPNPLRQSSTSGNGGAQPGAGDGQTEPGPGSASFNHRSARPW